MDVRTPHIGTGNTTIKIGTTAIGKGNTHIWEHVNSDWYQPHVYWDHRHRDREHIIETPLSQCPGGGFKPNGVTPVEIMKFFKPPG